jgi:serine/threonine protein kinase
MMGMMDLKGKAATTNVTLDATYNMRGMAQRPRPTRTGRYQLGEALGAGAMGVVYRAHDPDLDRAVAIKVVRTAHASSGTRLMREAQAMARLHHPNVVPIFDVGPAEGAVFVAMPLLEGERCAAREATARSRCGASASPARSTPIPSMCG